MAMVGWELKVLTFTLQKETLTPFMALEAALQYQQELTPGLEEFYLGFKEDLVVDLMVLNFCG